MKAIKIPVTGEIEMVEVPDPKRDCSGVFLHTCQEQVDGYIEIVKPRLLYSITMMPHTACMLVDEDGIPKRKPVNRRATELYGAHSIVGDVLIVNEVNGPFGAELTGFTDELADIICFIMNNRFD